MKIKLHEERKPEVLEDLITVRTKLDDYIFDIYANKGEECVDDYRTLVVRFNASQKSLTIWKGDVKRLGLTLGIFE